MLAVDVRQRPDETVSASTRALLKAIALAHFLCATLTIAEILAPRRLSGPGRVFAFCATVSDGIALLGHAFVVQRISRRCAWTGFCCYNVAMMLVKLLLVCLVISASVFDWWMCVPVASAVTSAASVWRCSFLTASTEDSPFAEESPEHVALGVPTTPTSDVRLKGSANDLVPLRSTTGLEPEPVPGVSEFMGFPADDNDDRPELNDILNWPRRTHGIAAGVVSAASHVNLDASHGPGMLESSAVADASTMVPDGGNEAASNAQEPAQVLCDERRATRTDNV